MSHFELPRASSDRESFVLEACKGIRVLHLGCADAPYTDERIRNGSWLHAKVSEVASECIGVDLNDAIVRRLRDEYRIQNIIAGDAERLDELGLGKFDLILAGEIIEHLNNPGLFLAGARNLLNPGGKLLITTANAFCFRRFIRIPVGVESVHPDHTYYFSHVTLDALVSRFGYTREAATGYTLPNKSPLLPYLIERAAFFISPNWGEGIIHLYSLKGLSEAAATD